MRIRILFTAILLTLFHLTVTAQTVALSQLELETTGYVPEDKDTPVFSTGGIVGGCFLPASWIRIRSAVRFYTGDTASFFYELDDETSTGFITFDGANVTFPELAGSSWSLILFTGYLDNPASDSLFREFLKIEIEEPEFHVLPAGMAFSPESDIDGTGLAAAGLPGNANIVAGVYSYWNDGTGDNAAYSFDLRLGAAGQILVASAFGGVTLRADGGSSVFRTGMTSLVRSGQAFELYAEAGLKQFDSNSTDLGRNMYLLFEPRVHLEQADITLSFFSSPVFPENASHSIAVEAENNYLGINLLFATGNLDLNKWRTGISFLTSMDPNDPGKITPLSFSISPFYTQRISDYTLDIVAVIRPLNLDEISEAGEIRILLKAVY